MLKSCRRCLLALFLLSLVCPPAHAQQGMGAAPAGSSGQTSQVLPLSGEPNIAAGSGRAIPVGLRELSPWSMFLSASLIVQAIIVGLAFASLVTWTIFIAKEVELFVSGRRLNSALNEIKEAKSLTQANSALSDDKSIMHEFVAAAIDEVKSSSGIENDSGIKERALSRFSEIARAESRRVRFGMGVLATIGATAPFVGLFGTVWGVMNSFIGISKLQTTNLAVVAPGIAEALLATAIGLFAAIPAVIIYNHFSRATRSYLDHVNRAAGTAERQLSRDLDRMGARSLRRAAE
jgi:biopolymer transport protein ExbB